jgi:GNAT superfamily N-acetyltransferase
MNVADEGYQLRKPDTDSAWDAFHRIRRSVLFESRGRGDIYDPAHPDDRAPDHFPLLLWHGNAPIGVIRLDCLDDGSVITRLVAIDSPVQRRGHGRAMLRLSETWARERGARRMVVNAAIDAEGFYEKMGYRRGAWRDPYFAAGGAALMETVQMIKPL